jgi:hypothetical protein
MQRRPVQRHAAGQNHRAGDEHHDQQPGQHSFPEKLPERLLEREP